MHYHYIKFVILLPLVLQLVLSGCGSTNNLSGDNLYQTKPNKATLFNIVLKPNQRFSYSNNGHLIDVRSEGNYTTLGNQHFLNSDKKYYQGVVSSFESIVEKDVVEIHVLQHDQLPLIGATVTLNNSTELAGLTDDIGMVRFGRLALESIQIYMLGDIYEYQVKDPNANLFGLRLKLNNYIDVYFENKIFVKKKNRLIDSDGRVDYRRYNFQRWNNIN